MLGTGQQVIKKIGLAFIFTPDPIASVAQATIDLGTLTERTFAADNGEEVIYDDREGEMQPITVAQNKFDQTYDLTTRGLGATNLAMYYRAASPTAWTQSAATATDIPHKLFPNSPIKILDALGVPVQMVASITNLKVGAATAVRAVDYDYTPGDLDRGLVYILPTTTLVTGNNMAGTITYGTAAVTAGFQISPLTGNCTIEGYGEIHGAACGGRSRFVDTGRYAVTFPSLNLPMDAVAGMKCMVRKLLNTASATPQGKVYLTRGF